MEAELPDGTILEFPDDIDPAVMQRVVKQHLGKSAPTPEEHGTLKNIGMGALNGASDIGTTLLWPIDAATDAITGQDGPSAHERRKASLAGFFDENANPDSLAFRGGKLGVDIAGTAGAGGVLAKGAQAIPALARFAPALASGGFDLGAAKTGSALANTLMRMGAGGAVGGASAGLIDPETAGVGAGIGALMPPAVQIAGQAGARVADRVGLAVSPEVKALYGKAKEMGIDIPLDRLTNSRPMNALAASLNYLPFSGRSATEDAMLSQLNRAASRTMGQDSSNIPAALRGAKAALGSKFDDTLKSTTIALDDTLQADIDAARALAKSELVPSQARIITGQIDDILNKGATGEIEGQAAYNIKRTLDRIGKRNSPEAHYAQDLRNKIIDALNRSLGPDGAAEFGKVRQQYGNMKTLERMSPNGAEGEITAGRLGSARNIRSRDLQDVADVAAQFVRTRESPHGAMQRIMMGGLGAAGLGGGAVTGTLPVVAGAMGAGRLANTALNSETLQQILMNPQMFDKLLSHPALRSGAIAIGSNQ
ncbi:hypothetical protein UFOVP1165_45 [uncultured Caudovirales phage]|uniref:Uncharacterized protein n=1 Tax=uncultured Caudovirales phage TaxID=2100421 RepID=A0A6J5QWK5_9CAUD|nr:hypothetical protein UFOVP1165_45 [uncultured Caudovirales phage]